MKKSKLVFGILTTMTLVFSSVATCFADESVVSKSQDNITVTKSAEWTTIDGKSTDASGNPYAKINFKIDTTNATTEITNTISKGGNTDIVMLLDDSGSMSGTKINKLKTAAASFIDEVTNIQDVAVNVGIFSFATGHKELSKLTSDATVLKSKLNTLKAYGGTELYSAVPDAQKMIQASTAKNKFFIILTDGEVYSSSKTVNLLNTAKTEVAGLKVITVGYDAGTSGDKFLKEVATKNAAGQPMFYDCSVTSSSIVTDLKGAFEQITEEVKSYVVGNSLVDAIPKKFSIVDGTIQTNDTNLVAEVSADKKSINWNWGENKLEKKVYEMSVITVLDKAQVPEGTTKVFTNGTTIDVTADSSQSAVFSYGSTNKLYLNSPILSLATEGDDEVEVEEEEAPLADNADQADAEIDSTPSTGDTLNSMVFVILGVCAVAVIGSGVALSKKRNNY